MKDAREMAILTIKLERLGAVVTDHSVSLARLHDELEKLTEQQHAILDDLTDLKEYLLKK